MRLQNTYSGSSDPFRGDQTLVLNSLPDGARMTRAVLKLTLAKRDEAAVPFEETFPFADPVSAGKLDADVWGVTKTPAGRNASRVQVNFHVRETLVL